MSANDTRRRVTNPSVGAGGSGRFRSGSLTQAAEQYSAALSRPAADTTILRGMDAVLVDLAASLRVVEGGMTTLGRVLEEGMPAEHALHVSLTTLATQIRQAANEAELVQMEQRRRNAADWERIENAPRANERGYDWQANQQ
ncbi:hypothetical protein [Amycolatopsis eburnea]|uniref:Uncharacterized protein n=1 Tax=Amycolatopsis eburnea TaxID=2267691 RepID=A0A3R9E8K3_9PSEU|nr:hypothetical protein [Amycolatopsis eburnea]RSD23955.1 hypothetical protein EIY87_06180 [Amycolatopsis eburnea]